jgi:hypothetical protein
MSKTKAALRGAIVTAMLFSGFSAQASLMPKDSNTASASRQDQQTLDLLAKKGADDRPGHSRRGRGRDDGPNHTFLLTPPGLESFEVARRGADDPVGHVRHGRGSDDAKSGHKNRGRGSDDATGHGRRGRGSDDAPGDDNGRRRS